ncbi:MAG TPA: CcoQ/FixQ family Cbb3-type cytochrome c oxidase assembly chaperone [Gemmatimonadales bacterium]|nr:CcoQ/FixQ family Cbb3-type cytochrome c oxidase assembly chaperone [Gemmatimonadales bacterium]
MRLSDIMSNAGLAGYAEIALVLFLVAFLAIAIRIFWPGRKKELDEISRLPLDDDPPVTPPPGDRS